ncbi:MAG TPA: hypothetical protein VJM32_03385 [Candidatus Saccharimonadales bacterium]|nr:hypothetical protein [Candidatus Saccharimonadales bacterium]
MSDLWAGYLSGGHQEDYEVEKSARATWTIHVSHFGGGRIHLSWSIRFKDTSLGGVHLMANEDNLIGLAWNRGEYLFEGNDMSLAYLQFDIEADDEPLEEDLFVQVFAALQLELYRYLRRHRMPMHSPSSKLLAPIRPRHT